MIGLYQIQSNFNKYTDQKLYNFTSHNFFSSLFLNEINQTVHKVNVNRDKSKSYKLLHINSIENRIDDTVYYTYIGEAYTKLSVTVKNKHSTCIASNTKPPTGNLAIHQGA
jgi:hypothetical protein